MNQILNSNLLQTLNVRFGQYILNKSNKQAKGVRLEKEPKNVWHECRVLM